MDTSISFCFVDLYIYVLAAVHLSRFQERGEDWGNDLGGGVISLLFVSNVPWEFFIFCFFPARFVHQ